MQPNINPDTGIRYGIISANNLDPNVIDQIRRQGEDLAWNQALSQIRSDVEREADAIEEEAAIAIAEVDPSLWEDEAYHEAQVEAAYNRLGFSCREDFIECKVERASDNIVIMEMVHRATIDECDVQTTWLGGALLVWVFNSPHVTYRSPCSPCVPNAVDLDSPLDIEGGVMGYDVPADWRRED